MHYTRHKEEETAYHSIRM